MIAGDGAGMKQLVERVMDKGAQTSVDVIHSPSMIATAIAITALHFTARLPVNGSHILDSPLVAPENAAPNYFPNSPA